jgi:hypothetical protein
MTRLQDNAETQVKQANKCQRDRQVIKHRLDSQLWKAAAARNTLGSSASSFNSGAKTQRVPQQ